jgi:hypothetical protein
VILIFDIGIHSRDSIQVLSLSLLDQSATFVPGERLELTLSRVMFAISAYLTFRYISFTH